MRNTLIFSLLVLFPFILQAQNGYVHTSNKQIVDSLGNNLLFKSLGLGNWMLQEGYMMQTAGVAGTQWEFKKKLVETIGIDKTNQFYTSWLNNHFRRIDVDSMTRWGFNCIRPALHYKVFTLPIEEEPIQGANTWLEEGFVRLDSLMAWCAANKMYVILDMHGAPGGQGKDAAISDYDASKPSLWESEANKAKFVALWRRIAERYATNKWIAGYDLLNETNWTFPEGNNSQLRSLLGRVTTAIREVDPNHMIVIEGNGFANDYSGMTPAWDSNMTYSFHKYWTVNDPGSIRWILDLRNNTNCPIWLGESGENSNRWFTDCIELMESNNIGWSFWPEKKSGINNILKVTTNSDYIDLINYWKGNAPKPSVDNAFNALMTFSENHKLENCTIQKDVIDAMIRQPSSLETVPFKNHTTSSTIFAVDYDFGRAGLAYSDSLDANYRLSNNTSSSWNNGYSYRNDGVDIEKCTDIVTNGYQVGWVEKGDWMQYTIQSTEALTYNILLRYASSISTAKVYVEIDGKRASKSVSLTPTGSWSTWRTAALTNVIVPAGTPKVKLVFENGGANLNYFQFRNPKSIDSTVFEILSAETATWANSLTLKLNKPADSLTGNPFIVTIDGKTATILSTSVSTTDKTKIEIKVLEPIFNGSNLKIDYLGNDCLSGTQQLAAFQNMEITNKVYPHQLIPGKIEAESFNLNNGFSFETCTDLGNGKNTSYAAVDKYLDYYVWVNATGSYAIDFRISVNTPTAQIAVLKEQNGSMIPIRSVSFSQTGGWQNWQTQSSTATLTQGKNTIRLLSRSDGYNLNWIQFSSLVSVERTGINDFLVYPNPAHNTFFMQFGNTQLRNIELIDLQGRTISRRYSEKSNEQMEISGLKAGIYILKISEHQNVSISKLQVI
ncbi:MAG TPA: carbohydrate-binding protein [Bacteroidales bacterium]|nr:carbohydrate-binding protein [Bacteroidales bacterium]